MRVNSFNRQNFTFLPKRIKALQRQWFMISIWLKWWKHTGLSKGRYWKESEYFTILLKMSSVTLSNYVLRCNSLDIGTDCNHISSSFSSILKWITIRVTLKNKSIPQKPGIASTYPIKGYKKMKYVIVQYMYPTHPIDPLILLNRLYVLRNCQSLWYFFEYFFENNLPLWNLSIDFGILSLLNDPIQHDYIDMGRFNGPVVHPILIILSRIAFKPLLPPHTHQISVLWCSTCNNMRLALFKRSKNSNW